MSRQRPPGPTSPFDDVRQWALAQLEVYGLVAAGVALILGLGAASMLLGY